MQNSLFAIYCQKYERLKSVCSNDCEVFSNEKTFTFLSQFRVNEKLNKSIKGKGMP